MFITVSIMKVKLCLRHLCKTSRKPSDRQTIKDNLGNLAVWNYIFNLLCNAKSLPIFMWIMKHIKPLMLTWFDWVILSSQSLHFCTISRKSLFECIKSLQCYELTKRSLIILQKVQGTWTVSEHFSQFWLLKCNLWENICGGIHK